MKAEVRILNGYRLIYEPSHPRSIKSECARGYIYEHIFVAEKCLGRHLAANEVVHHLDGNRENNRRDNLLVLDRSQHNRLEMWIRKNQIIPKSMAKPKFCPSCGRTLQYGQKTHCSHFCLTEMGHGRKVKRPGKDALEREIGSMSWVAIGRKYGVSDNAVRKWAKGYGLLPKMTEK
jgi:hypothetical protein